jgi:esterase/lipase superfamily enzyme
LQDFELSLDAAAASGLPRLCEFVSLFLAVFRTDFGMPKYWMINDRDKGGTGTSPNTTTEGLTYWVTDKTPLNVIENWQKVSAAAFETQLKAAADAFPVQPPEKQSHVTILVHGYNVSFDHSASFYEDLCGRLFDGPNSLGLCILYDWPSWGNILGYEPDRARARECAPDLTDILSELFDWLIEKQADAIKAIQDQVNGRKPTTEPCKAKVSLIAHSMGNYLLQNAMAAAWTRKNQPLLVSLINQLLMVAADVDNDLFDAGAPDNSDGSAMVNLTYRITALYSGRDEVLGASAGLKHFGTRRLGRSGLAHDPPIVTQPPETDNVWDIDCSSFFPSSVSGTDIHGAYFVTDGTIELMRQILRGVDRAVLKATGQLTSKVWTEGTPAT